MNHRPGIAIWAATALLACLTGCGDKQQAVAAAKASDAPVGGGAAANDPMEIHADATLKPRLTVARVQWAEVGASVPVAARVAVDDTRVTRVGSPIMGRITQLTAQEGDRVTKGQLLGQLSSPSLSAAQLDFLKAMTRLQVSRRAVDRAKVLLEADVIGTAELQRREAEFNESTAELEGSRDQLLLLGMPPEAVEELRKTRLMNSASRVLASMDGTVMQRRVTLGQVVQPADTMFEIADLSHVWLVAEVPEHQAGHLKEGQAVEAQIEALSSRPIHGRLSFVSSIVNPQTRTVLARMNLPNPQGLYKPAMLASMTVRDQAERRQVVPVQAVVRDESGECLFIERPNNVFLLRPVKLGPEINGVRVLMEGVANGERIVTEGSFHLNNERRRRAIRVGEGG
jgi:cobalt-zinc-cadmium efflux system membrane fusion protein